MPANAPLIPAWRIQKALDSPGAWSGRGAPFKVFDPQKMGQTAEGADAPTLDLGALNLQKGS